MPNKSLDVLYALRGLNPPLDAAGVLVTDGAWVVRAVMMGQSAGLLFARAFPQEPMRPTDVKIMTYGVKTDERSYRRGQMQRGLVTHSFRMLVIDSSQVPDAVRELLSGTEDELKASYKAQKHSV